MKIAVICPHRNDRPGFISQFKKYLAAQTIQPDMTVFVDYEPETKECDITQRYKRGYNSVKNSLLPGAAVLFMEVDDYYAPNYIETMVNTWLEIGQPNLFGLNRSIYYHVSGKYFSIDRPSTNGMLLKSGLDIDWDADTYPYVDITLTRQLIFRTLAHDAPILIGIKHGMGMVGGGCHDADNERYNLPDENGDWLRSIVGDVNFEFYKTLKQ